MEQSHDLLQWVGNILLFWSAAVGVASVAVHARVPWWRSEMGVHLMCYMVVVGTVLVLSCVRIIFGDSEGFRTARLLVFVGVPIVMTHRLILQIRAQLPSRKD